MRTVAKLTKADRRRRAWLHTDRALISGLTRLRESEAASEAAAFANFCADLDCVALKVLPIETLKNIHRRCLPVANRVRVA